MDLIKLAHQMRIPVSNCLVYTTSTLNPRRLNHNSMMDRSRQTTRNPFRVTLTDVIRKTNTHRHQGPPVRLLGKETHPTQPPQLPLPENKKVMPITEPVPVLHLSKLHKHLLDAPTVRTFLGLDKNLRH